MPEVQERRDLADDMSERVLAELTPPHRSEGHHVSSLIAGIVGNNPMLVNKPNTGYYTPDDWAGQLRGPSNLFSMGLLWERLILEVEADRGLLPGWELPLKDGITGTPDGVHLEEEYVMESKLTWKSIRSGWPADNWRYMTQVQAYLYNLATGKPVETCLRGDTGQETADSGSVRSPENGEDHSRHGSDRTHIHRQLRRRSGGRGGRRHSSG